MRFPLDVNYLLQLPGSRLQKLLFQAELWKLKLQYPKRHFNFNYEDKLFHKVISKYKNHYTWKQNIDVNGMYHFSPSQQLLAITTRDNNTSNGIIISSNDGHVLDTIDNIHHLVLPNDHTALYVTKDTTNRPWQVWHHKLGDTYHDKLLLQNSCEGAQLNLSLTRDNHYITMTSSSRLASEVYLVPITTSELATPPFLVKPVKQGLYYFMEHAHDKFYILTNYGQDKEFKIMTAMDENPDIWEPYYTPDNGLIIHDMEVYKTFVVVFGTTLDLAPAVIVKGLEENSNNTRPIVFQDCSHIQTLSSDFSSDSFQVMKSSVISPPELVTINSSTQNSKTVTRTHTHNYVLDRIAIKAKDGVKIPITLFYDSLKLKMNGTNPLLVRTYGAHGISLYTGYNETLIPLLRKGWILAYCHIRGGGDLGRQWYFQAIKEKKVLSFSDLYCCITTLHSMNYSSPEKTAIWGISAGAHSVAMVCNLWPELVQAVILEMPLVNLLESLKDQYHFINKMDIQEFGDPKGSLKEHELVQSLCPYCNLNEQNYPSFFITASSIDPLISISSVSHYIHKLMNCIAKYREQEVEEHVDRTYTRQISDIIFKDKLLERGTVIFQQETKFGHWAESHEEYRQKQALYRILFLNQVIV